MFVNDIKQIKENNIKEGKKLNPNPKASKSFQKLHNLHRNSRVIKYHIYTKTSV